MTTQEELRARNDNKCELCSATDHLSPYDVPPSSEGSTTQSVLLCNKCSEQINDQGELDVHHWRCLNESMWSLEPAVQVMVWRTLTRLTKSEAWASDLLDQLYLDEDTLSWAKAVGNDEGDGDEIIHQDANGARLFAGDTVTLIKDLNVKGAGFTAKRGTAVRGISLVGDNDQQIEGRVGGQQIVLLTQFVKKSG